MHQAEEVQVREVHAAEAARGAVAEAVRREEEAVLRIAVEALTVVLTEDLQL